MFKRELLPAASTTSSEDCFADTCVLDWIDAWPPVREDVLKLLAAYEQAEAGHDISSFLPLLDEVDTALRMLRHRVEWLRVQLGRAVVLPLDRP